jgi:hypothetical protein
MNANIILQFIGGAARQFVNLKIVRNSLRGSRVKFPFWEAGKGKPLITFSLYIVYTEPKLLFKLSTAIPIYCFLIPE